MNEIQAKKGTVEQLLLTKWDDSDKWEVVGRNAGCICVACEEEGHDAHVQVRVDHDLSELEYEAVACEHALQPGQVMWLCRHHLAAESERTGIPEALIIAGYEPALEDVAEALKKVRANPVTNATVSVRSLQISTLEAAWERLTERSVA